MQVKMVTRKTARITEDYAPHKNGYSKFSGQIKLLIILCFGYIGRQQ